MKAAFSAERRFISDRTRKGSGSVRTGADLPGGRSIRKRGNAVTRTSASIAAQRFKLVRNKGELPRYYAEDTHPAIIDMQTFRAAQAVMETHREHFCGTKPTTRRYPFSGKIVCGNCGKNYSHKVTHGFPAWQCTTFLYSGKSACPAKQIPEDTLTALCCTALDLKQFNETEFKTRIDSILVTGPNAVQFRFKDGHNADFTWKDRSRAESWTDEMKEAARNRSKARSEETCQE